MGYQPKGALKKVPGEGKKFTPQNVLKTGPSKDGKPWPAPLRGNKGKRGPNPERKNSRKKRGVGEKPGPEHPSKREEPEKRETKKGKKPRRHSQSGLKNTKKGVNRGVTKWKTVLPPCLHVERRRISAKGQPSPQWNREGKKVEGETKPRTIRRMAGHVARSMRHKPSKEARPSRNPRAHLTRRVGYGRKIPEGGKRKGKKGTAEKK